MALVQYGGGVARLSGRMAGNVFASNRGGAYMRRYSVPVNGATVYQQSVRQNLANASSAWRNLEDEQRQAWKSFASTHPVINRLGAAILLSGQQAFVALNRNGYTFNGTVVNFAEVPAEPVYEFPFQPGFVIAMDASSETLTITNDIQPDAATTVFVWASPLVSPGVTFTREKQKLIQVITVPASAPAPISLTTNYLARFGSFIDGTFKKQVIEVQTYSNGQVSGLLQNSTIVVA